MSDNSTDMEQAEVTKDTEAETESKSEDDTSNNNTSSSKTLQGSTDNSNTGPGNVDTVIIQDAGDGDKADVKMDLLAAHRGETGELTEGLGLDFGHVLSDMERTSLFEEGLKLDSAGEKDEALKCYLQCLLGLTEGSKFVLLPECLRNISEIYFSKEEYDKAVSFLQAEKLYYENVLVNDVQIQERIDHLSKDDLAPDEVKDETVDSVRATEYEQLARLCMDEKQPQLALEYAGKATKIRQQLYGDTHPLTKQTLDFFASMYAEVGKQQYAESLKKHANRDQSETETTMGDSSLSTEPVSILRKRKSNTGEKEEKKVRFDESHIQDEQTAEREERFARLVLWILFFLCILILCLLGTYILCHLSKSETCQNIKSHLYYSVMRVRYWYYHLSSNDDVKYT